MYSTPDLPRVIRTLARLDHAGLLNDFLIEVAEASRGPKSDLDRWPGRRGDVERLARMTSTLFGIGIGPARDAACEALLPSTRRGIALEILDQFEQRLDDEEISRMTTAKVAKHRRRVAW